MYFRFTLFNSITLFIMAMTIGMIFARFRLKLENSWLLLYYLVVAAFWLVFEGSLAAPWVIGGMACGVLLRFEFMGGPVLNGVRVLEMTFFGYTLWRCTALLLLWPW
jgi:hypothetical protein